MTNVDAAEFINRYVCGKTIEEEHIIEVEKNIYDIDGKNKRYGENRSGNIKSLYDILETLMRVFLICQIIKI